MSSDKQLIYEQYCLLLEIEEFVKSENLQREFKTFENDECIVYAVKSRAAAIALGQGTGWCTAKDTTTCFVDYNRDGNCIYYVIDKHNEQNKFGVIIGKNNNLVDFRDIESKALDLKNFSPTMKQYDIPLSTFKYFKI